MKAIDLAGKSFGKLTVVRFSRSLRSDKGTRVRYYAMWLCRCDCGVNIEVRGENLRSNHTLSCGCVKTEGIKERSITHGLTNTVEYEIWTGILTRCRNPRTRSYRNYGGRGITICEHWLEFSNFLQDIGHRPSSAHSIDRIDNNGNYEPSNCRWATAKEQAENRRPRSEWTVSR